MSRSRIFLVLMLAFIGGVGVRSLVFVEQFWPLLGLGVLALAVLAFSRHAALLSYAGAICASLVGIFWYGHVEPREFALTPHVNAQVVLEGAVVRPPEVKEGVQRLVIAPSEAPDERVRVSTSRYPEFAYGDTVRVSGTLERPENFDGFNYVQYLAKDGIYFVIDNAQAELIAAGKPSIMRALFALRRAFEQNVSVALTFPHSAYVNGILLGQDSEIPKPTKNAFVTTGTSHVLALSGYNITVIIAFVALVLSSVLVSRATVVWAAIGVVVAFVLMTGASPSVVRAGVMGVALLLAQQFGRQGRVLNVLVFAAFVMILFNPKILLFDIGFQLSFLAVLGLAYIYPYLWEKLKRVPERFKLKESFVTTVSAQAAVLPLVLYAFHSVSLVAPLANMLILPVIPFAMLFGFLAGAAGFVSNALASMFAWPLWALVEYQLSVVEYAAGFSYAAFAF